MKKNRKQRNAIMAAVILLLTVHPPGTAYGEDIEVTFDQLQGKKDVETELVGNIEVTLISAAVPSDVEFTVDPLAEFDAVTRPDGQITSPQGLAVANQMCIRDRLFHRNGRKRRQHPRSIHGIGGWNVQWLRL